MSKNFVSPYQQITNKILADLKAGVATWAKPWKTDAKGEKVSISAGLPMNFQTRKQYRMGNVVILLEACWSNGWTVPAFATAKQIAAMGGKIVKGSKGTHITNRSLVEREPRTPEEAAKVNERGLFEYWNDKCYSVFNLAQCEGIEIAADEMRVISSLPEDAAELVDALNVKLREGGNEAFYSPVVDFVAMPKVEAFETVDHYRATLYHEIGHWTGHTSRLDRLKRTAKFGNKEYAFEELVAELSAAFLAAEYGIEAKLRHAEYIGSWIKLFTDKDDAFQRAASEAQKVLDFIRDKAANATSAEAEDMREAA